MRDNFQIECLTSRYNFRKADIPTFYNALAQKYWLFLNGVSDFEYTYRIFYVEVYFVPTFKAYNANYSI